MIWDNDAEEWRTIREGRSGCLRISAHYHQAGTPLP